MNFFSLFKRNLIFKFKKKIDIDNDVFNENISLDELCSFYKTDKAKHIKITNTIGHGYSIFYQKHLENFQNKKINILEIGSYSGASAAAFAKFFPKANIYCLDVNLTNFIYKSKQIYPYGIDATKIKMVNKFLNKINYPNFHIIIDDGSHILSDQLNAFNIFFKFVPLDGYYIIEEYKFPEYFEHLNNTIDPTFSEIINDIKNNKNINVNLFNNETSNLLKSENLKIFEYSGEQKISDIVFFKK